MFEGDSADTYAGKFPMGGRAEGLACTDPGARKLSANFQWDVRPGASGPYVVEINQSIRYNNNLNMLNSFCKFLSSSCANTW